jgi:hypothetical protein
MFQFTHIEGYALSASTKRPISKASGKPIGTQKSSVGDIVAELLRDKGHCDHVENPTPPIFHYGSEAVMRGLQTKIEKRVATWSAKLKAEGKKALRKDTQVLFTQIVSYPKDEPGYEEWRALNIAEARAKYGDRLEAIAEHLDEDHPHLHIYALMPEGESPDVKRMHPGHVAAAGVTDPKAQRRAYTDGMRAFQDDYYEVVGRYCGMTRIGPGRRRLPRPEYMAEKAQAAAIKQGFDDIAVERAALDRRADDLTVAIAAGAEKLMRTQAAQKLYKSLPRLPDRPSKLEMWKLDAYLEKVVAVVEAQAGQLSYIDEMRDVLAVFRADKERLRIEVGELTARVDALSESARAWSVVQQIAPGVAADVVARLSSKPVLAPVATGPASSSLAYFHADTVLSLS